MVGMTTPDNFIGQRVEAIPGKPLPHGLLNVATIVDVNDAHELNGVQWNPITCGQAQTTVWCPEDSETVIPPKDFVNNGLAFAPAVAVYYGYECPPIGETYDEAVTKAKAGLAIGRQAALEKWLWEIIFAASFTDVTPTPGTSVSIKFGLGLLEHALGATYGGVGIIHVPLIAGAALAADYDILPKGAQLTTYTGNLISLGAGYPNTKPDTDVAPALGKAWLVATGPVILRGETRPDVLPDSDSNGAIKITTNDRLILAEAGYVVGVECAVVGVLVDVT